VILEDGRVVAADLVILGLGVRPSNQLAVAAGLPIGPTGGILTDAYQRTPDLDIYAVGDAAEYPRNHRSTRPRPAGRHR